MSIRKETVASAIDLIYRLDCLAYPEEMTTKQWYLDRYKGKETVFVYEVDGVDVAYLAVMDVKKALYEAVINGVLDGDVVVSNNMFDGCGKFFYIASSVVDADYRHRGIFGELLQYALNSFPDTLKFALVNEHTKKAVLNYGFTVVNENGHYSSVVKY